MNNNVLKIIKDRPLTIPKLLFNNYKKLNITEEEFIILIYLLNINDKIPYNPKLFTEELNIDKYKAMELINSLSEKNIITIKIEKNKTNITEEYIYLDLLYDKLTSLIYEQQPLKKVDTEEVFTAFEKEFGRPITPMEYEQIKNWITEQIPKELIIEALKEATFNGVSNIRYIEKILSDWQRKGLKTKEDIIKDKTKFKNNKKKEVEVYDYNWLEDE